MKYQNSPVQKVTYHGHELYVKRDDLLDNDFSGNKARKFYYYLKEDFPTIKRVVSHGSAQSNAMYSLSVLCKLRNWQFDYYVDHIASYLKENPQGNFQAALENGMNIYEETVPNDFDKETLFIPEGGAIHEAQVGIKLLANEITSWAKENGLEDIKVFLASGTGTTALYLQKYVPFEVLTCACVGGTDYLKKQFLALENNHHPTILSLEKKHHFGKLYRGFYETYLELQKQTEIEFDLLYDALGFITLMPYLKEHPNSVVLYIHQGGVLGNVTMLERYKRKYPRM